MNNTIESVTLQDVEVQENGIIRNEKGRLIGRLVDDVEFESEHVKGLKRGGSYMTDLDKHELKQLYDICIEDDLLDLDSYNSIERADKISSAWQALKVIKRIVK